MVMIYLLIVLVTKNGNRYSREFIWCVSKFGNKNGFLYRAIDKFIRSVSREEAVAVLGI